MKTFFMNYRTSAPEQTGRIEFLAPEPEAAKQQVANTVALLANNLHLEVEQVNLYVLVTCTAKEYWAPVSLEEEAKYLNEEEIATELKAIADLDSDASNEDIIELSAAMHRGDYHG